MEPGGKVTLIPSGEKLLSDVLLLGGKKSLYTINMNL